MIETRRLKNVVVFLQTVLSFLLSRKIIKIYNDIARKHWNVTIKEFRKYEKLKCKQNKFKLDIQFLNNCKQLNLYPEFLIFKLLNVLNKDALSIRERLLRSTINKRNKELQHVSKELSQSEIFFIQTAIYYWLLHPQQIFNISQQEIVSKTAKYSAQKTISLDKKLQPTYILV